ncbi:MAG TPA: DUF378 domain-containing protein [Candidatus Paceibacterota bacterium]|nr:DUF378 domain-containing protein [Candidatus Paceibacterota bacterium]
MKALHIIAFILVIVGGLNWLLIGLFGGYNLVAMITGAGIITTGIYILVGLAALFEVFTHASRCRTCSASSAGMPAAPMAK